MKTAITQLRRLIQVLPTCWTPKHPTMHTAVQMHLYFATHQSRNLSKMTIFANLKNRRRRTAVMWHSHDKTLTQLAKVTFQKILSWLTSLDTNFYKTKDELNTRTSVSVAKTKCHDSLNLLRKVSESIQQLNKTKIECRHQKLIIQHHLWKS